MIQECSVRRASPDDLAAVLAIERECAEASHWSEATWRSILEENKCDSSIRAVFVAERPDAVLGFVVVQCAGGSAELETVAVKAEARQRGVASALYGRALAWAAALDGGIGATEMHLEVRASNAAALQLYAALGFVEQGRRRGYYREPVEDAVLMVKSLARAADVGKGSLHKGNTAIEE